MHYFIVFFISLFLATTQLACMEEVGGVNDWDLFPEFLPEFLLEPLYDVSPTPESKADDYADKPTIKQTPGSAIKKVPLEHFFSGNKFLCINQSESCSKKHFPSLDMLLAHIYESHLITLDYGRNTQLQCFFCEKIVDRQWRYYEHWERHFGVARYNCASCQRKFIAARDVCSHSKIVHKKRIKKEKVKISL